jgi:hypothetical protein
MPKPFIANPGDTMLSIAAKNGFIDYRTLWNDPTNAALKKLRVNPFVLVPKDTVNVVDLEPKREDKPTNRVNLFTLALGDALLRLKLLDQNGKALADRPCDTITGQFGPPANLNSLRKADPRPVTAKDGLLEVEIARDATDARIEVRAVDDKSAEFDVRLRIGFLPPVNSLAGQRARLNQLGLYAGFAEIDTDQLRWAIEEFEHLHGLPVKGKPDNATFFNTLGHVHGDLLKSESLALPLVPTESET